jgi:predicted ATPase
VGVLDERFPDLGVQRPELLADHATRAGMTARAVDYWLKAGRRSMSRSAMTEAVLQLNKGLDAAALLPAGPSARSASLNCKARYAARSWRRAGKVRRKAARIIVVAER